MLHSDAPARQHPFNKPDDGAQQAPAPATTPFASDVSANVQGDVIIGLQKRVEAFVFFNIHDSSSFRHILKDSLAHQITSTGDVQKAEEEINRARSSRGRVWLPLVQFNIGFSALGLEKLGVTVSTDFPNDLAFAGGMEADAVPNLADPQASGKLTTWKPAFLGKQIDGVLLVTAHAQDALDSKVRELEHTLGKSMTVVARSDGIVRPGDQAGHEHFGFKDGISVPTVSGFNDATRPPGTDALDPSIILTGQNVAPAPWTKNGSFLVVRELQQLVPEFNTFLQNTAVSFQSTVNGITADTVGARIVGRWKSGAPVVLSPLQDDPALGNDSQRNMDFDYSIDLNQEACPYAAHLRKTNPRKGTAPATPEQLPVIPHLFIRQGIPFGPEVSHHERESKQTHKERGLLFACYQSSIEQGFQFVQKLWVNNPNFPFSNTAKITAPGQDLIIGQVVTGERTTQGIKPNDPDDANNTIQVAQPLVVPHGGEYFFVPSIDSLKTKLGA